MHYVEQIVHRVCGIHIGTIVKQEFDDLRLVFIASDVQCLYACLLTMHGRFLATIHPKTTQDAT